MFESKYSKVLTIVLVIVIVAILGLLGFLGYDYYKKYSTTKQASEFVNSYQGDVTTGDSGNTTTGTDNNEVTNTTLDGLDETPNTGTNSSSSTGSKKTFKGFTTVGTMKIPKINLTMLGQNFRTKLIAVTKNRLPKLPKVALIKLLTVVLRSNGAKRF